MTPKEAIKVVGVLCAVYPAARMTEATIEIYESLLQELEFDVARAAVERLVRTSKFLPTVAEILEAAAENTLGPQRTGVEAWGDVMKAIRRFGYIELPTFDDPIVTECVRVMGWRNLCLNDVPESVDRARFSELYADLQKKQRARDVSEPGRLLPPAEPRSLPGNVREITRNPASLIQSVAAKGKELLGKERLYPDRPFNPVTNPLVTVVREESETPKSNNEIASKGAPRAAADK